MRQPHAEPRRKCRERSAFALGVLVYREDIWGGTALTAEAEQQGRETYGRVASAPGGADGQGPGPLSRAVQSFSGSRKSWAACQALLTCFSFHLKSQMTISPAYRTAAGRRRVEKPRWVKQTVLATGRGFAIRPKRPWPGTAPRAPADAVGRLVGSFWGSGNRWEE